MIRFTPATRLSWGLVMLTACVLLIGDLVGLTPGRSEEMLDARRKFCETLAVQFALAVQGNDFSTARRALEMIVARNEDVLSAALRSGDGRILAQSGDHGRNWEKPADGKSTPTHAFVPIFRGSERWGSVEVRFTPLVSEGLAGVWEQPLVRLTLFVSLVGFVAYWLFMRKALRHLDPSAVIPGRVKAALDVLAEGVVLLDERERIVLANTAFAEKVGRSPEALMGRKPSDLGWRIPKSMEEARDFPWIRAMQQNERQTGTPLALATDPDNVRTFMVSGAPILDDKGKSRGALATFDDVTELEEKTARLEATLTILEKQQDEIRLQNEELQILATRDPLTGCLNRRSFFEMLHPQFTAARDGGSEMACIMADIDYFKAVNDTHGHLVGDKVLQGVSELFRSVLGPSDAICRYGGEEFCVLLGGADIARGAEVAERARAALEGQTAVEFKVTCSFGVSSVRFGARNTEGMIDQADMALYASKEGGRNRVTRWDETEKYRASRAKRGAQRAELPASKPAAGKS